ncbi:hypothetical protein Nepgr_009519 [Nepenthes gracilis]|uniref:Alpha/beta hydrolase fold-3 domain-containing protein n=1 Tax=Nepenthes gracilis TaxID=150966 RepID=A0AAD3XKE9_NEPGR|nr:hypothetical protein Nepgr_009519 [Nepenthes gracilis]
MAIERQQSLSLPWKTKLQLSVADFVTDMTLRRDGTLNRRLVDFLDRKVPAKSTPRNGVRSHDVTVDAHGNVWFRVFVPTHVPSDVVSLPVIFFFHGGGFSLLSAATPAYDAVCRRFARKINAVVVSLNYRLAPEHKFPAQYDDGFDALKFIDENRQSLEFWPENADVGRCFLAGDSAGGNLAHHLGVRASQAEFKEVKIIGLIVIQPFFYGKDRTESEIRLEGAPIVSRRRVEWMWKAFLPKGEDLDHWAVNVSGPNAVDISGLEVPPVILFVGGFDPLRDWQLRYHDWLKNSGKDVTLFDVPTVCHAFYVFPEIPESLMLIREITDFIEKQSSKIRVR